MERVPRDSIITQWLGDGPLFSIGSLYDYSLESIQATSQE